MLQLSEHVQLSTSRGQFGASTNVSRHFTKQAMQVSDQRVVNRALIHILVMTSYKPACCRAVYSPTTVSLASEQKIAGASTIRLR